MNSYAQEVGYETGAMDSLEVAQFIQYMRPIIRAEVSQPSFESGYLPSPDATGVPQYMGSHVSLYTGVPQISIPIYDIEVGDYKLPVSLQYYAGGIRVAQEASRIGLGWNLQAGGVITRSVSDLDDLHYDIYCNEDDISIPDSDLLDIPLNNTSINEPDIFIYNFAGYKGRFYVKRELGKEERPHLICRKDDVFVLSEPSDRFKISIGEDLAIRIMTTENILYTFSAYEVRQKYWQTGPAEGNVTHINDETVENSTLSMSSCNNKDYLPQFSNDFNVITAWYLTKINLPTGDSIMLDYEMKDSIYRSPIYVTRTFTDPYSREVQVDSHGNYTNNFNPKFEEQQIIEGIKREPELRRISWELGSLEFLPGANLRTDIRAYDNSHKQFPLSIIELHNTNNSVLRSWHLHQSYFKGHNSRKEGFVDFLCDRLRLDSVSVIGTGNERLCYRLAYEVADSLPPKNTLFTDRWGYYTGIMLDNDDCVFDVDGAKTWHYNRMYYNWLTLSERIRNIPSPTSSAKTWSLKEITYPTGIKVSYEYENNDIYDYNEHINKNVGGIRVSSIKEGNVETIFKYNDGTTNNSHGKQLWDIPLVVLRTSNSSNNPDDFFNGIYNTFSSVKSAPIANAHTGHCIGYSKIKSIFIQNADSSAVNEYCFTNNSEYSISNGEFETSIMLMLSPNNGKLTKETKYASGVMLQENSYSYCSIPADSIIAIAEFRPPQAYVLPMSFNPIKRIVSTLSGTDSIQAYQTRIKSYEYNTSEYIVSSILDSIPGFLSRRHEIIYSADKPDYLNGTFLVNNLYHLPLEESFYMGEQLTERRFNTYHPVSYPALHKRFIYEAGSGNVPTFSNSGTYTGLPEIENVSYTSKGKPLHIKTRGGQNMTILWSYRHQYPVAQITGVTPSDISAQGIDPENLANKTTLSESDWNSINDLRAAFPAAFLETVFYEPLVGISRKIDGSGYETRYHYDGLGRLTEITEIKNGTEILLKKYEHKYATEN